jgi:hypothetical protein
VRRREPDEPSLTREEVNSIINFLMKMDARLEAIERLLREEDDDGEEEENADA